MPFEKISPGEDILDKEQETCATMAHVPRRRFSICWTVVGPLGLFVGILTVFHARIVVLRILEGAFGNTVNFIVICVYKSKSF